MNKNSNVYIIIYASVMIIIVAVLLSVASMALKSRQQANIAVEKQGAILSTIGLGGDADKVKDKTKYIEQEYEKYITDSYVVNGEGDRVEGAAAFGLLDKLKDEYAKPQAERQLPVFVARLDDGTVLNVLAVYGAGLWGPIWGYIALGSDWDTIRGAVFDHQGETPGLGAEIEKPAFSSQFTGKRLIKNGVFIPVAVVKAGQVPAGDADYVDGISGGTITSKGVGAMIDNCLQPYSAFLESLNK